jgi:hypothetical protein
VVVVSGFLKTSRKGAKCGSLESPSEGEASADGGAYLTNFGHFVEKWQSGAVPDLKAGLTAVDQQNNAALKLGQ